MSKSLPVHAVTGLRPHLGSLTDAGIATVVELARYEGEETELAEALGLGVRNGKEEARAMVREAKDAIHRTEVSCHCWRFRDLSIVYMQQMTFSSALSMLEMLTTRSGNSS